jgi:hypothetical protein
VRSLRRKRGLKLGAHIRQLVQNGRSFVFVELEDRHRGAGNETQHGGAETRPRGVIREITIPGISLLKRGIF